SPYGLRTQGQSSFPPQKSNTRSKLAPLNAAEVEKLGGVDIIVYHTRIPSVCDVVESGAQGEVETQQSDPPFAVQIQRKKAGKAAGIRIFDQPSILVDDAEWIAAPPFHRIRQIDFLHQRRPAP